jgi:hypothetical protein
MTAHYILFMDESGDHNLSNIADDFPVFCLTGCIFESLYYREVVRPKLDKFKEHFWGTRDVILRSRDIRRHEGRFAFLHDPDKRKEFYFKLDDLMQGLQFTILSVVIQKHDYMARYGPNVQHPYHLSFKFIMERYAIMMRRRDRKSTGRIIAESRGQFEDGLLKGEYNRLKGASYYQRDFGNIVNFWMEKKRANIAGLQIADLVAYPIAAKVLHPDREQKAFDIIGDKFDHAPRQRGGILGYGLKIFPQPTHAHYLLWGGGKNNEA